MYPHRIRLGGPWHYEPISRSLILPNGKIERWESDCPSSGQFRVPASWSGTPLDGFRGRVRWRRGFQAPRQLDPDEQLWLTFGGVDYFASVSLNGVPLGDHEGYFEPFEFDITNLLTGRNELSMEVECPAESNRASRRMLRGVLDSLHPTFVAGLWRGVALEVRSIAQLRNVRIETDLVGRSGRLSVTGRVVGRPGTKVTVELIAGEAWLDQTALELAPEAAPFALRGELADVEPWWPNGMGTARLYPVRVVLHGAARTLDTLDRAVGFREIEFNAEMSQVEVNDQQVPPRIHELDCSVDPLLTRPELVERQLAAAHQPGTLAVFHPRGRIAHQVWYDWADRRGVPLIQEFPCSAAGIVDTSLRTEAVREAEVMACQLAHHPSIFLWSCNCGPGKRAESLAESVGATIRRLDSTRIVCCQSL